MIGGRWRGREEVEEEKMHRNIIIDHSIGASSF